MLVLGLGASGHAFITRLWDRQVPEHLVAWRSAARQTCGDRIGVLTVEPTQPTPVERARLIATAWELAPRRVQAATADDGPPELLASSFLAPDERNRIAACGYQPAFSNEFATVWTRGAAEWVASSPPGTSEPSGWREGLAIIAVLGMLVMLWRGFNRRLARPVARRSTLAALGIFAALAALAVAQPLLPPNGLGVYGGKAKLLYLLRGFPADFWTARAFAVFQPAYPPGLALLAWLVDVLAGGCGERLVQLLVPAALALVFLELTVDAPSRRRLAAAALVVLAPVALDLAAGFYAEPFAVLCLACGLHAVTCGFRTEGALLAGAAAMFRPEGGLLALVFVTLLTWPRLRCCRGTIVLAAVTLPMLCWQLGCRLTGARLEDLVLTGVHDWRRCVAFAAALGIAALQFWTTGGALLLFLGSGWRMRLAWSGGLLILAACAVLAGFHQSPHFAWVADTYAPRLVWMVLVGSCACARKEAEWTTC